MYINSVTVTVTTLVDTEKKTVTVNLSNSSEYVTVPYDDDGKGSFGLNGGPCDTLNAITSPLKESMSDIAFNAIERAIGRDQATEELS